MNFDKEQKRFPTMQHKDIYMTALRARPPEITTAELEKTDPDMAESARQYYAFYMDLLGTMYEEPEAFGFHPGAWEEYAAGRKYTRCLRDNFTRTKIMSDRSGAELNYYLSFLNNLASRAKPVSEGCVLSAEDFAYVTGYSFLPTRAREFPVPTETVLTMLARQGLEFYENPDGGRMVVCHKYPEMFRAMIALQRAVDDSIAHPKSPKLKYFFAENGCYLDFRQITGNYAPVYEDTARILPEEMRARMDTLRAWAKAYKLKEQVMHYGLGYYHKSERIIQVWCDWYSEPRGHQKDWRRSLHFGISGSWDTVYTDAVLALGDEFKWYFMRHLNYCSGCTPEHLTRPWVVRVFDRPVRICGVPGGVFENPTEADMPYVKAYLDLKMQKGL